jgi:hypothetical protein|tara:strand:- start:135 stop:365 length:231 start_codon:yes stop_codon:yes gene_type:complete
MTQYSKDILDVETDFHMAVEKIVNELSDDVADAMRQAEKLLSTDKFRDLSVNDEYANEQLEEFVSQLWIEHRENKL